LIGGAGGGEGNDDENNTVLGDERDGNQTSVFRLPKNDLINTVPILSQFPSDAGPIDSMETTNSRNNVHHTIH